MLLKECGTCTAMMETVVEGEYVVFSTLETSCCSGTQWTAVTALAYRSSLVFIMTQLHTNANASYIMISYAYCTLIFLLLSRQKCCCIHVFDSTQSFRCNHEVHSRR
jgi:hypothetical protein